MPRLSEGVCQRAPLLQRYISVSVNSTRTTSARDSSSASHCYNEWSNRLIFISQKLVVGSPKDPVPVFKAVTSELRTESRH